jgi:hypothetical protein
MGGLNSGDRLARGGVKAQFMTSEGGIPADKWAQAFDDFDPEKFKAEPEKSRLRSAPLEEDEQNEPVTR